MFQRSETMTFKMFNKKAFCDRDNASSWQHPYLLQRRWVGTKSGVCFKCGKSSHKAEKNALHLNCCQDPIQAVYKQDTGELIALLCPDKVDWFPQVPSTQESLSDILGLAVEEWYCTGTFVPNDYGGTWGSCLGSKFLSFLIDSEATSFLLTQVKFVFLRSDGVWWLGW